MKTLIICCGLAGVGKTTHIDALVKKVPNTVYLDKDTICTALLERQENKNWDTPYFKDHVRMQSYDVMNALAKINLAQGRIVILEGNMGDKLTSPLLKDFFSDCDLNIKIFYFHCSAEKQLDRVRSRMEVRDLEKLKEGKFLEDRYQNIKKHLINLVYMPHLLIDTETDVEKNIVSMVRYLALPTQTFPRQVINELIVDSLPVEDSTIGAISFSQLVKSINPAAFEMKGSVKIKLVCFDFGGVLGQDAEFSLPHQKAFHQRLGLIENADQEISEGDARKLDELQNMRELIKGKVCLIDVLTLIAQQYPCDETPENLLKLYQDAFSLNTKTVELLNQLLQSGTRVVITTSNSAEVMSIMRNLFKKIGIDIPIYCSSQIGISKSTPDFWTPIFQQEKVDPSECLLIDDRHSNVLVANSIGMHTIYFTSEGMLENDLYQFNLLSHPLSTEVEKKWSTIASSESFLCKGNDFSALSLSKQLKQFSPFEIGRGFRRNCEIDYYFRLAQHLGSVDEENITLGERAFFWQNLSFSYLQKGRHQEALKFADKAETWLDNIPQNSLPLFRSRQAQIRGPLARELEGNTKTGIEILQEGLRICEKIVVHDTRYLVKLNLQRDLALCFLKEKDFKKALWHFKACLLTAQQGKFDLFCFAVSNYIALSTALFAEQKQKEGSHEEAKSLFSDAVKTFLEVNQLYENYELNYREHHQETFLQSCQDYASHVFHFGISYCNQGFYDEALVWLLKSIEIRKSLNLQGQLNNRVAEIYEWVAKAYRGKQNIKRARHYATEALDIYRHRLEQPDFVAIDRTEKFIDLLPIQTIAEVIVLADHALVSGNQLEARDHCEHAFSLLSDQNCLVAGQIQLKMGDSYRDSGDRQKAKECYQYALGIFEKYVGEDLTVKVDQLITQGNVCHISNDYSQAMTLYKRALGILQNLYGIDHLITCKTLRKLGDVVRDSGDYLQAEDYYRNDLSILEKHYNPGHLMTASTLRKLAYVFFLSGNDSEAKNYYERALEIKKKNSSHDLMAIVNVLSNLASLDCYLGNIDRAEKELRESIKIIEQNYGSVSNRYMAFSLKWLARVECSLQRYDAAKKLLRQVQVMEEELYPRIENKEKGHTLLHLAILFKAQKDYLNAEKYLDEAQRIFDACHESIRYKDEIQVLKKAVMQEKTHPIHEFGRLFVPSIQQASNFEESTFNTHAQKKSFK